MVAKQNLSMKVVFLLLATVAAEDLDACAASPEGCAAKTEADGNTLVLPEVAHSLAVPL